MNRRRVLVAGALVSAGGAISSGVVAVAIALFSTTGGAALDVAIAMTVFLLATSIGALQLLQVADQRRLTVNQSRVRRELATLVANDNLTATKVASTSTGGELRAARDELQSTHDDLASEIRATQDKVHRDMQQLALDINQRLDKSDVKLLVPMLDRRLADTSLHLYRQLEARSILGERLAPNRPLPPMRGWVVSPDLALHLVERVLAGEFRKVLEAGSGVSTLLCALALQRRGEGGSVVALEHDERYAAETRKLLDDYGCSDFATVVFAPLVPVDVDGETYRWYDLASMTIEPTGVDLLFVDGPPAATGPRSRLPALPLLQQRLAPSAHVVLDDGRRDDENAVASVWVERYGAALVPSPRHEKGTIELVVNQV